MARRDERESLFDSISKGRRQEDPRGLYECSKAFSPPSIISASFPLKGKSERLFFEILNNETVRETGHVVHFLCFHWAIHLEIVTSMFKFDLKTGSCNLFYRAIAENCCCSLEKTQPRYCHVSRECFPHKKNSACISPNRAVHPADVPPGRKSLPRYMNAAFVRSFARSIFNESLRNIELHLLIHFLFFTFPYNPTLLFDPIFIN